MGLENIGPDSWYALKMLVVVCFGIPTALFIVGAIALMLFYPKGDPNVD